MKYANLIVLLIVLALASCNLDDDGTGGVLVNSSGLADEVIVVGDPALWKGELEDAVRKEFYQAYPVLPQYEPSVKLTFVPFSEFERLFKRHRNIIFIADLSSTSSVSEFVSKSMGDDYTAKALNDPNFFFALKENAWARPQVVMFIFGNSKQQLLDNIETNGAKLTRKILDNDIKNKYRAGVYVDDLNYELQQQVADSFQLQLDLPKLFFTALSKENLMWLRRETGEASYNLFITTMPIDSFNNNPLAWRNSLGQYVKTNVDTAHMVTDTVLAIESRRRQLAGLLAIETRGLWRMKYDFMGGPFVNYTITDSERNRVIMLDVWIFAPKVKKKPLVRYMETVVSTLRVGDAPSNQ